MSVLRNHSLRIDYKLTWFPNPNVPKTVHTPIELAAK